MRTIVIGGTGHIGTYLVPRLVAAGHEVINVSRQNRSPYHPHMAWKSVKQIVLDRTQAEQAANFAGQIRALAPDVVIDLISFTLASTQTLVEALHGQVGHFLHCGTTWVHGPSEQVPTTESQARRPFGEYGLQKAAIERYLLAESHRRGFPATILHPGHIVGPGWVPLNPAGNFNPQVFVKLARGAEVSLPNLGLETVHHVHADDVAQGFMQALANWSSAVGESFHVISPAALTLRGYAEAMAAWFGQPAQLRFVSWEEWQKTATPDEIQATWDHLAHSPNCSIEKARRLLNYQPRYSSLQAVQEAVEWLIDHTGLLAGQSE
jgi:nucleoside-diphosphate-sugar epimerase